MKFATTLIAAAFVAGSATLALAQAAGTSGAGSDLSTPRQSMQRPTPNSPPVNRRGDDMAPMQSANVSNEMTLPAKSKSKNKSQAQMNR